MDESSSEQNYKLGGPQTENGKNISKMNSLKHGILSSETLLISENGEELAAISKNIVDDLRPVGELETILVDMIIANIWRLKRLLRVERISVELRGQFELGETIPSDSANLIRYETTIERGIFRSLHELERRQAARLGEKPPIPTVVDIDVTHGAVSS